MNQHQSQQQNDTLEQHRLRQQNSQQYGIFDNAPDTATDSTSAQATVRQRNSQQDYQQVRHQRTQQTQQRVRQQNFNRLSSVYGNKNQHQNNTQRSVVWQQGKASGHTTELQRASHL